MRRCKINYPIICFVFVLVMAAGCTTPAAGPTLPPRPMPSVTPTPAPGLPTQTETPPGLPDLAWAGMPTLEPLAPIVSDKFQVKQSWKNNGPAATVSEFDIRLEIIRGNISVFDQYIKVPQPVKPLEERTLDVAPEYVIPEPGSYQVVLTLDSKAAIAESRKDNNVTKISLLDVPDLSKEPEFNKGTDMAALAQAEKDINKYRKGDVILTVVDSNGQPRPGLRVEYAQTEHSFLFGVYCHSTPQKVWLLMKEAGINYLTVELPWSSVEPSPGVYQLGTSRTGPLQDFNLAGIGYELIFLSKTWSRVPDYIVRSTSEEFRNAVYPHIYRVVSAYKQDIKMWNVFNEPMWQYSNILGLTEKQTIEVIREGTRAVHDAGPQGRVLINNYNVAGEGGSQSMNPYDFLRDVIGAGVDFDIIGLECYYNAYTRDGLGPHPRRTLASIAELIDKYSALGKKIQITELSVPSSSVGDMKGYWGELWSQELQAEYLKTAYTLFFSKLQVEGITWWMPLTAFRHSSTTVLSLTSRIDPKNLIML